MAETTNNTPATPAPAETTPAAKAAKSGLIKYIIYGVIGLVVVGGIAFGTLMFFGGKNTADTPPEPATEQHADTKPAAEQHAAAEPSKPLTDEEILDSLMAGAEDTGVMDAIMENLSVLDYKPDESELTADDSGMSPEDSLEAVNWIDSEKKRLAAREDSLNTLQKQLNRQEQVVNQKILKIEQAESARIVNLARLYDGMDSRAVARLMTNLDDNTVVSILPRMKSKNAAAVLQLLPAQRAASLSKQMITIAEN